MKEAIMWIADEIAEKTGADLFDVLEDLETVRGSVQKYFLLLYLEGRAGK